MAGSLTGRQRGGRCSLQRSGAQDAWGSVRLGSEPPACRGAPGPWGVRRRWGRGLVRGLHTHAVWSKEAKSWAGSHGPLGTAGTARVHLLSASLDLGGGVNGRPALRTHSHVHTQHRHRCYIATYPGRGVPTEALGSAQGHSGPSSEGMNMAADPSGGGVFLSDRPEQHSQSGE